MTRTKIAAAVLGALIAGTAVAPSFATEPMPKPAQTSTTSPAKAKPARHHRRHRAHPAATSTSQTSSTPSSTQKK